MARLLSAAECFGDSVDDLIFRREAVEGLGGDHAAVDRDLEDSPGTLLELGVDPELVLQ
jgi:hypothetical protein